MTLHTTNITDTTSLERCYFDKINPSTGLLLKQYPVTEAPMFKTLVASAREAFLFWSQTPFSKRSQLLREIASQILNKADSLAECISLETGKPFRESFESDLTTATQVLYYYAKVGPALLKEKRFPFDRSLFLGRIHYAKRVPKGVVGIISPWNYPLAIPISGISASLMAGNTVILKPSELTPGVGEAIGHVIQTALQNLDLPTGVFQVAQGESETGKALIQADIDHVIFTGSTQTGFEIREALQKRGKSVSLELGGSDPMIVLEGADIDTVASYALWGRYTNAGQACAAVKRLFVPQKYHEALVQALKQKIQHLQQGDPQNSLNHIGPLISQRHLHILSEQVQDAVDLGAQIEIGGYPLPQAGWFYPPTLVTNVPKQCRLMQEEVFGPVLPVVSYQSVEEAIELANDQRFGLTASVFGPSSKAEQVAKQLEAGLVTINDVGLTNYALPSIPWHGWKNSGPGVSHGPTGLLETTHSQTITVNWLYGLPFFRKSPWHFNYTPRDLAFSKGLLQAFGRSNIMHLLKPGFLWQLFRNRSSQKL